MKIGHATRWQVSIKAQSSIPKTRFILVRITRFMLENTVAERTKYQQNIIRNYYDNRETISLQRAQEIITELYLSEGKKRQKYWKSLEGHLLKLEVKQPVIDNLITQDDPQIAAKLVERLGKALD